MGKIWFSRLLFKIYLRLFLENLHCISFWRLWSKKGFHWNSANTGFNQQTSAQWDSTQRYSVHTGFHLWYSVITRFKPTRDSVMKVSSFLSITLRPYLSFLLSFFVTYERLLYNLFCPSVKPWFVCTLLLTSGYAPRCIYRPLMWGGAGHLYPSLLVIAMNLPRAY